MKCRNFRWTGREARMEEGRSAFKILADIPIGKRLLVSLGVDGRIILEWALTK